MLIGIPITTIILVFAFVNNDLVTFSLWPFTVEATVSLSVVVIVLTILGFIMGRLSAWFAYAPLRRELFKRKKENRKLSEEHKKLNTTVDSLKDNLENLKAQTVEKKEGDDSEKAVPEFFKGVFSRFNKNK